MNHLALKELLARYDRPGPRYTSYPTAVQFTERFDGDDYARHLARANAVDAPLSLYLHLPFCERRCLFCACNTIVSPRKQAVSSYLEELDEEIGMVAAHLPDRRQVEQLHLGGGTPTYFAPHELAWLMERIRERFDVAEGAELSVEVDPRVTTPEHINTLVECGFTRLSIGVQDLDPTVQEAIARVQSLEQIRDLMTLARARGIRSINVDLIYGLPHQTVETFRDTVEAVIALGADRLAIYSFAYVPWIKGHQKKLDAATLPGRDLRFELQALARCALTDAGYIDIGMDHFARPDDELAVAQREGTLGRNFMGYTVSRAPDLIGFGISAIGYVQGAFVQNTRKLSTYRRALERGEMPVERGYALNGDDMIRQQVIQELMCNFCVDKTRTSATFSIDFDDYFADALRQLEPEVEAGMITIDADALKVTPRGRLFIRNLAMAFDRYLKPREAQARPVYSQTV